MMRAFSKSKGVISTVTSSPISNESRYSLCLSCEWPSEIFPFGSVTMNVLPSSRFSLIVAVVRIGVSLLAIRKFNDELKVDVSPSYETSQRRVAVVMPEKVWVLCFAKLADAWRSEAFDIIEQA